MNNALSRINQGVKRLIDHFGQPLILIKKSFRSEYFRGEVIHKKEHEIKIKGKVTKPNGNELLTLIRLQHIDDKSNVYRVYTLYLDIEENDLIIMHNKNYEVIVVNNHSDRGIAYLDLYIIETIKEILDEA